MERSAGALLQRQKQLSENAQRSVLENASGEWVAYCLNLIENIARANQTFTSDVVMLAMTRRPHDPRALGPVMKMAQKKGYIRPTDEYRPSVRRHATPLRVWQSCLDVWRAV
jgi:hypothetical protein